MDKSRITTVQYATAHKKANQAKLEGLQRSLADITDEYERSIIENEIDICVSQVRHYDNMIHGRDDDEE